MYIPNVIQEIDTHATSTPHFHEIIYEVHGVYITHWHNREILYEINYRHATPSEFYILNDRFWGSKFIYNTSHTVFVEYASYNDLRSAIEIYKTSLQNDNGGIKHD